MLKRYVIISPSDGYSLEEQFDTIDEMVEEGYVRSGFILSGHKMIGNCVLLDRESEILPTFYKNLLQDMISKHREERLKKLLD